MGKAIFGVQALFKPTANISMDFCQNMYLQMKDRINNAVEMGSVPEEKQKELKAFKDWTSESTSGDHQSTVQVVSRINHNQL